MNIHFKGRCTVFGKRIGLRFLIIFLVFEVEVALNFFTIREINQAPAADGTRNKIITILKNGTVRSDWVQLWGRKYLNINKNWSIFLPVAARAMENKGGENLSR